MKRVVWLTALLLGAACTPPSRSRPSAAAAPGWPPPASPAPAALPPTGSPAAGPDPLEAAVLTEVNARRQRGAVCGGKPFAPAAPLKFHTALQQAARAHSADMAARNYFSHDSLDGRSVADRLRAAGYRGMTLGENIAAGKPTAREVVEQWMNSPPHCSNLMDRDFTLIGIGHAERAGTTFTHYWTQDFGS